MRALVTFAGSPPGLCPAAIPLGAGSTYDCGSTVQTGPAQDGVDHINVPGSTGQGIHYDVFTTLTFTKQAS